jgi:hypothetical protein
MKKSLIDMLTLSKDIETRKEIMINRNMILLTRTTRMSPEELFHQEGL